MKKAIVFGYGNTGKALAKKLSGFSCEVLIYDRYIEQAGDEYTTQVSLNELVERADIVSVHIPYNVENHYFINHQFLSSFKKKIVLINTSRGKVLNTEDLVLSLENGKVKAAGLDVLEFEKHTFENVEKESVPTAFKHLLNSTKTPYLAVPVTLPTYSASLLSLRD